MFVIIFLAGGNNLKIRCVLFCENASSLISNLSTFFPMSRTTPLYSNSYYLFTKSIQEHITYVYYILCTYITKHCNAIFV